MKRIFFYILMFTLTAAFCYAVLEFGFARFYYSNVYLVRDFDYDDEIGWCLKPGTYLIKPPNRFNKHTAYINRYGIRCSDITPEKQEGETRIVILGDSFTYGKVSNEEEIFSSRLEKLLNGGGGGRRFDVLNAGVMGYGTAQEWLLMKRLAEKGIVGDVYVVMFFTNDILDNLRLRNPDLSVNKYQPGYALDGNGRLVLEHPPYHQSVTGTDSASGNAQRPKRTNLLRILEIRIESFLQTKPEIIRALGKIGLDIDFPRLPGLLNAWYHDEVITRGVPLMKALLAEIRDEAERRDAVLLVGLIPSQVQIYSEVYGPMLEKTFTGNELVDRFMSDQQRPQRIMGSICDELGVPFLDLYPILRDNNDKSLYIPREGHFSSGGHEITARSLSTFIMDHVGTTGKSP